MKMLVAATALMLAAAPTWAAKAPDTGVHPFGVRDLVMMDRVADPQLSPDGRYAAFSVRSTDYAANKGTTSVYVLDLAGRGGPVKLVDKAGSARWSADGHSLYYMAAADGVDQLWRRDLDVAGGALDLAHPGPARQVTHAALDLGGYKLAPDGSGALLTYDVFPDCADLACTRERLDGAGQSKASGVLYHKLFVRHWDTWADGRRNQLFAARFEADGNLPAEPTRARAAASTAISPASRSATRASLPTRLTARRCTSTCASPAPPSRGRPTSTSIACRPTARRRRRT